MLKNGYTQCQNDHTLFFKQVQSKPTALIVYFDDIMVNGDDESEVKQLKIKLMREFRIKDLWQLKYFLGIYRLQDQRVVFFCLKEVCV